jgi:integral membrane protein
VSAAEASLSPEAPAAVPQSVRSALLRYQVIAYVVGVGLIILVLVGVPLQVWANNESVVKIVGPLHGALYVIYLLLTLDLARRVRLNPVVAVLVMVAGTIPFLSFVAERKVTAIVPAPPATP